MIGAIGKPDKIFSINHRLGRISLHTVASKTSTVRVRKMPDGSLEVFERVYGGVWSESSGGMHEKLRSTLIEYLEKISADGYFYIEENNFKVVNRRFNAVNQSTL